MTESGKEYDVVIVGGGVVGIAILERFTQIFPGKRVCLLEKHLPITGASAGNSGVFHTGFDAPPGSIEVECMKLGYKFVSEFIDSFPKRTSEKLINKRGALVVAWTEEEAAKIEELYAKSEKNQVPVEIWSGEKTQQHENNLSPGAKKSLFIPEESVVDPFALPILLLSTAINNSGVFYPNVELLSGEFDERAKKWKLLLEDNKKQQNIIHSELVINCAGNYGDLVENALFPESKCPFSIVPRKGQFIVYEKVNSDLLQRTILPIPKPKTKGILICPTIFGNILVGPTAEDQTEREIASLEKATLSNLQRQAEEMLPGLKNYKIIGSYAGLRPATQFTEYQIRAEANKNYICVGGIRSTGLTACCGIGIYVINMTKNTFPAFSSDRPADYRKAPNNLNVEYSVKDAQSVLSVSDGQFHVVSHKLNGICLRPKIQANI